MKSAIVAAAALVGALAFPTASSAEPVCQASSPVSNEYSVTICLTEPVPDTILIGDVPVSATVALSGTTSSISRVTFSLGSEYVLNDFQAPYSFQLPSARWVDGARTLSAKVTLNNGFASVPISVPVTFSNGTLTPPINDATFTPRVSPAPAEGPYMVAAVGDGASGKTRTVEVADLVDSWDPQMFLYLGDVYENGSIAEFHNYYGGASSPYFGRFKDITNPIVGNHEYNTSDAQPYFYFWDNVPHYYSYDAGGWHFIALDSTTSFAQTSPTSAQYQWLQQDLATSTNPCKIAYFHHPLFANSTRGGSPHLADIWNLLDQEGVDAIVTGHEHNYERWMPLDSAGNPSPTGIPQIVVGTGGQSITRFAFPDSRIVAGADTSPDGYGALRLGLSADSLAYEYVTIAGTVLDSGTIPCTEPEPVDTTPPSAPGGLTGTATAPDRVQLAWTASSDDTGVMGYEVYRDGSLLERVGPVTSAVDPSPTPGATHAYSVKALDAAGNTSEASSVNVTVASVLFSDGFETGNFSRWSYRQNMVVQSGGAPSGSFSARAVSTGGAAHVRRNLTPGQSDFYWRFRFKISDKSSHSVYLTRLRTADNAVVGGLFLNPWSKLAWRNNSAGKTLFGPGPISQGVWHTVEVHAVIAGASSQTEVWLDGTKRSGLSTSDTLGTAPVTGFQIGESQALTGRSFDLSYDDAVLSKSRIGL